MIFYSSFKQKAMVKYDIVQKLLTLTNNYSIFLCSLYIITLRIVIIYHFPFSNPCLYRSTISLCEAVKNT